MKVNIELNIKPFRTPNFVSLEKSEDGEDTPGIPIKQLDAETLDRLCEHFTKDIFRKAGKQRPEKVYAER